MCRSCPREFVSSEERTRRFLILGACLLSFLTLGAAALSVSSFIFPLEVTGAIQAAIGISSLATGGMFAGISLGAAFGTAICVKKARVEINHPMH